MYSGCDVDRSIIYLLHRRGGGKGEERKEEEGVREEERRGEGGGTKREEGRGEVETDHDPNKTKNRRPRVVRGGRGGVCRVPPVVVAFLAVGYDDDGGTLLPKQVVRWVPRQTTETASPK